MIYIDPPYNTGNDFVRPRFFLKATAEFWSGRNQTDRREQAETNTTSNGRSIRLVLSMNVIRG